MAAGHVLAQDVRKIVITTIFKFGEADGVLNDRSNIIAMVDHVKYSYSRLILPLADDGRRVNMLLVCINDRMFDDFSL